MKTKVKVASASGSNAGRTESADDRVAPIDYTPDCPDIRSTAGPHEDLFRPLPDDEIAKRAYSLWESRGCQGGSPDDDWQEAIRELTLDRQRTDG